MDNSLKTLLSWRETIDQINAAPFIRLFGNIRVSGTEKNIMPFGSDTWEKFLTMFFNTTRDVRNASGSGNEDFHEFTF